MLLAYWDIAHLARRIVLGPVSVVRAVLHGTLVHIWLNRSLFEKLLLGQIRCFPFRCGMFGPLRFSPLPVRRIASIKECRGEIRCYTVLCLSLPL